MKTKTRIARICALGVLTALYVVLSAFLKINLIGNIQLDLGYIVFAVALCAFGPWGAVVGVVGCALESILFSAYGFSVSWVVANAVIGIGCGFTFAMTDKIGWRVLTIILSSALGLLGFKTVIECSLYAIPYLVKIPKNVVAFAVDSVVMIVGLLLASRIGKYKYQVRNNEEKP